MFDRKHLSPDIATLPVVLRLRQGTAWITSRREGAHIGVRGLVQSRNPARLAIRQRRKGAHEVRIELMQFSRFQRLGALVLGVGVLSGCEMPMPTGNSTQPVATPAIEQVAELPREQRAMARAFVEVVNNLEPVAERECRNRSRGLNCDFLIVVDDRLDQPPNAFQTLDETGRPIIAFTISMIAHVRNADELAFIMAHEAAHHIQDHLTQQRRNATIGAEVFGQLAGVTGGGAESVRTAQELGAAVGARSYSKDFELEADRLGTIIAARAGYNPLLGADFFFRVPDPGDRFLGTHPANAQRVQVVRETMASL